MPVTEPVLTRVTAAVMSTMVTMANGVRMERCGIQLELLHEDPVKVLVPAIGGPHERAKLTVFERGLQLGGDRERDVRVGGSIALPRERGPAAIANVVDACSSRKPQPPGREHLHLAP